MIVSAKEEHPRVCERTLCRLFSVSRSWYYGRAAAERRAEDKDIALRDAIERIVCWSFPALWLAQGHRGAQAGRLEGEPQAGFAPHARGIAPVPAKTPLRGDHGLAALLPEAAEPHQGRRNQRPRRDPDCGHHLRPAARRLLLPGGDPGRLLPQVRRLGPLALDRHPPYALRALETALTPSAVRRRG